MRRYLREKKEICREIVRCGCLDGSVNIVLDYFDASVNRISAWTVGLRNVHKALLPALITPNEELKGLQDDSNLLSEWYGRQRVFRFHQHLRVYTGKS